MAFGLWIADRVKLVLIDGRNLASHRAWLLFFAAGSILAAAWYGIVAYQDDSWPGGASAPGLVIGVVAALLILFEFALWPRKKLRVWRIGRAQTWMRAHIWLGLLTVPLVILHSGFRLGGALPTVLMLLFAAVIASGVFGLWMQQVIPRKMLEQAPGETIYSQIARVAQQLCHEADGIVAACCEPEPGESPVGRTVQVATVAESHEEAGRDFRPWQVKLLEREIAARPLPNTAALREFHRNELRRICSAADLSTPFWQLLFAPNKSSTDSAASWILQSLPRSSRSNNFAVSAVTSTSSLDFTPGCTVGFGFISHCRRRLFC